MRFILMIITLIFMSKAYTQESATVHLPYQQIPDYPTDYTTGNIISRLIDGLGYRYYWATEGLTEQDLAFRPTEEARNTLETLVHIHGLSEVILNAPKHAPNIRSSAKRDLSFDELRKETLVNLKNASDLCLGKSAVDISNMPLVFQRGENKSESPFWHMINGPIADVLYHTGQVVSFRRSAGNPINAKVNVFMGKTGD